MKPSDKFPHNHLVKISQASEILGVSIDTLRRWEAAGKITPIRTPGGTRLYSLEELQHINPKIAARVPEPTDIFNLMKLPNLNQSESSTSEDNQNNVTHHINLPHHVSNLALITILFSLLTTAFIFLFYLYFPEGTTRFLTPQNSTQTDLSFRNFVTDILHSASLKALSPFNQLAKRIVAETFPRTAQNLALDASKNPSSLPTTSSNVVNVLGVSGADRYLEINTETVIKGSLAVSDEINGFTLTPGANGANISDKANNNSLTFSGNINLNQPLLTTSSPSFADLTLTSSLNVPTLKLSATSNQIVFNTNGTLTWAPSSAKTLTLPDVTGTLITKDSTDTLSNKTIKSSDSNTISGSFTGITGLGTITAGTWNGTKIAIGYGGTGLTSYTTGDILYASASDTLSKLTIGSSGQLLTISGGVPAWSTVSGVGGATGTGTSGQITFWNGTSTLTGSNSLWWDSANGNLGIGTTSPGNKLTVNGNVGIGTTAFTGNLLTVTGGNVGIGTTAAVGNLLTVNGNVGIGTTAFVNARLSVMTGNVGIGTTSPSYFLDVSGNIHTTKQIRAQYICDELGASCKDLRNTRWSRLAGDGTVSSSSKIASGTGGGPTLVNTDYFGESVSNIGDLNGDGVEDLAVGAVFDDTGGTNRGAVYILFMNTSGTVSSSSKIASGTGGGPTLADGDRFGASIADIGDLNSDGVQDLAVGVQRANSVQGAVYVLFMNTNGTVSSSVQIASGVNGGPTLADNDNFGQRLSNIGDLNGDGVEDLAVGAYGDDTGGANRGAVYVLFMKTDGTVSSSVKIASGTGGGPTLANTDYFNGGTGIGDLNGDGVEDMVAGAFEDDTGGTNRGAIYVLFMNTNGTVSSSVKIASGTGGGPTLSDSDRFGDSIGNMGDLNGDGVEDLAVGAYTDDTGGTDRGAVYVLFMKTDGTVSSSVKIASGTGGGPTLTDSDYFGRDVSNIGDLNGDGVEDLAVGAYGDDTNGTDRGAVYVLFMAKNNIYFASQNVGIGTTNPGNLLTINGGNVGIGTTAFVNSALSVMGGNVGIGTTTAGTSGKLTLVGTGTAGGFNFRVQDSNFADKFLILDNGNVGIGTTNPGNLLTINGNVGIGTTAFVNAGLSVMTGNVGIGTTAPGEKVEIAGNIKPTTNVSYNLGTQSLDTTADTTVTGDTNNLLLGGEISNAGDINGDGYADLLVGASTNGSIAGRAYIYYGSSSMDLTADVTLTQSSAGDDFGYATSSAGDFNGDGFADVIVGASTEEVAGLDSATDDGVAYIYYGGASMDTTADVTISAAAAGDRLGISVANAGDVNGDGYSDVIVGASKADNGGTNRGEAYLFYGGPSVSSSISASSADVILKGTTNSIQLGASVRSAGDINGDGYSDIAVAAVNNVAGSGKVFIFYGGPNLSSSINDSSANVTYTGESVSDYFGISVDNGDINGDGYPDLIVGADLNDNSSLTDNGRAYVFYGGPNLSSSITATSADVTLNGSVGNGAFGVALRFAGDINGDGYGDIMISEPMLPGEATAGKVYIYYGGASMDTTADITFNAENAGDNFGMGDGAAGDFNGDGYLDAITGATGDDTGGTNRGKVYFYQGSGNRWQSMFAQNLNVSRGLQIDNLMLDRWGLNSGPNLFGLTTPDWSISRYGTASFQNLISRGNVGIGTANPGNLLTINGGNVGIGTTAFVNAALSVMGGNVGIGTTSPVSLLQLRTDTGSDPSFSLADADVAHGVTTIAPTDDFFRITPISSTVGGAFLNGLADADGIALQLRGIQSATPTDSTPAIKLIGAKASGTGVQDLDAIETIFQVANNDDAAAFTILGNGNVGIGTTGPTAKLDVGGTTATIANGSGDITITPAGNLIVSSGNVGIGTTNPGGKLAVIGGNVGIGTTSPSAPFEVKGSGNGAVIAKFTDTQTTGCAIATDGTISCSSDLSLKKNITDIDYGLDSLMKLHPISYNWKSQEGETAKNLGFIAQEVESIIPKLVTTDSETGLKQLNTIGMIPVLTRSIQEQQDEINNLISKQANTANTLGNLLLNSDGSLTAPQIKTGKLIISADVNLNSSILNSPFLIRSSNEVDVLASLGSISDKLLGISTQESSSSAQLASLEEKVTSTSATLNAAIASQSDVIASQSEAISSQSAALAQNQTATLSLAEQLASAAAELVKTRSEVEDLKLTPPELLFSTSSATLANLNITSDASISGKLAVYQTTVSDTFKSLGETLLGRTTIAGDLAVDGTLSLTGNSLNSISTLYIQNSALAGSVDFFNGLVTIDNNGSLIAQTISTNAIITNKLTISNIPISSVSANISDGGTKSLPGGEQSPSIGSGKILAGQTKAPVLTTAISPTSKVFISPKSSTLGQTPFIELIQQGTGFVVSIDNPVSRDIDFDWWIVDTK